MASFRYIVNDVELSIAFYCDLLGFTLKQQYDQAMAIVESLRANGAVFRNAVVAGPGGQQILCEDPSGNVVELFQVA